MASTSESSDGPVLTVLSKRIRNLRKKLNRITQIEQSQNPIKNKEQQDLLLSKPSLVAVIDELEKLRLPLTSAVDEELKNTHIEKPSKVEKPIDDVSIKVEGDDDDVIVNKVVEDLVKVMYFGSVFNVKMRSEFENVMLTRSHERNCCLTYDYVADDEEGVILSEVDLDLLGQMSELLVSRPVDSGFSHEVALSRCVEHAKNWVARSEDRISGNSSVTYAGLREKLAKVISSDYYKITPEMKAPADVAAGSYVFVEAESEVAQHEQKEGDATDIQRNETYDGQSNSPVDEHPKGEAEAENTIETRVQMDPVEVQAGGTDNKEQYVPRRTNNNNQNQRGGGGRGNGRGYGNGRGGRRGGPYQQNGRNQYNDQQGNYYPRNQHHGGNSSRGRGGRGNGGGGYNNHASGGGAAEVAQSS